MAAYTYSRAISRTRYSIPTPPSHCRCSRASFPCRGTRPIASWRRGCLPSRWKIWAISTLADMRTGFPTFRPGSDRARYRRRRFHFATLDTSDLNVAIERMVTLRGYRFALRGGMDNITNQRNCHRGQQCDRSASMPAIPRCRGPPFHRADPVLWPRGKEIATALSTPSSGLTADAWASG